MFTHGWALCRGARLRQHRRLRGRAIVLGIGCARRTGQLAHADPAPDLDRDFGRDRVGVVDRAARARPVGRLDDGCVPHPRRRHRNRYLRACRSALVALARSDRGRQPDAVPVRPAPWVFAALAIGLLVLDCGGARESAAAESSGSATTVATTTTLPAVKTTHPGVRRMLVISISAHLLGRPRPRGMPNLSKLFAQSAVADLSVRGVRRVPSLADGYVTIGAGTRSVASPGRRRRMPRRRRAVRARNGARGDGAPQRCRDECDPRLGHLVPRAARDHGTQRPAPLSTPRSSALGDTLEAAGVQRAAIGNADTTLTPTADADYRRWAPLALTDENGIVPAGNVTDSLLDAIRPRRTGCVSIPTRSSTRSTRRGTHPHRSRAVVVVEDSDLVRLQSYGIDAHLGRARRDAATHDGRARLPGRPAHEPGRSRARRGDGGCAVAARRCRPPHRCEPASAGCEARSRSVEPGRGTRASSRSSTSGRRSSTSWASKRRRRWRGGR